MSNTPLGVIESFGAPTSSYLGAVNYFRYDRWEEFQKPNLSQDQMEQGIADIIGIESPPRFDNPKEAELYFLYTVQETVRAFLGPDVPDMADVWEQVQQNASKLIKNNPWSIKDYSDYQPTDKEPKLDATGKPKKKKGVKKQMAKEIYFRLNDGTNDRLAIIGAFINDIGMSKAGATTYFHDMKAEYGYLGPKTKKVRKKKAVTESAPQSEVKPKRKGRSGPSKAEIARQIFNEMHGRDKQEIKDEIIRRTGTTPAGANTYVCACIREAEE